MVAMAEPDEVDRITQLIPPWLAAVAAVNERIAREAGVGASDLTCWHEVVVDGPLPAGELARRLRLTTGAITRMVDRLIDADLVRRTSDDRDRRRVLIEAVPERKEAILERYGQLGGQIRSTLAQFSSLEHAAIARFFETSLQDTQSLLAERLAQSP